MTPSSPDLCRRGFTLLEVLVACGILVVALASIAAMLPAAASRLGDAMDADRSASAMAVAFSELQVRRLNSGTLFPVSGTAAVVFGQSMNSAVMTSATVSGYTTGTSSSTLVNWSISGTTGAITTTGTSLARSGTIILTTASSPLLNQATDTGRAMTLEDAPAYGNPVAGTTPANQFFGGMLSGTQGFRRFNSSVSWGAVISPQPWGTNSGTMTAVRASVGVFSKPGTARVMTLTRSGPNLYTSSTSTATLWPAAVQRTLLAPCTSVLALPPSGTSAEGPQWLRVRASWVVGADFLSTGTGVLRAQGSNPSVTGSAQVFVIFDPSPGLSLHTTTSGTQLTVLGFDTLLRAEERILPVPLR